VKLRLKCRPLYCGPYSELVGSSYSPTPPPPPLSPSKGVRYVPKGGGTWGGGVALRLWRLGCCGAPKRFRFSSLVPRVERDLPWSLSRPFCLSSRFNLPVDPYRTGEVCLAVVV
jgi:hypothetical protein